MNAFRPGIGLLLESRPSTVVIPTAIEGAWEAWPPGRRLPRPHRIRVTFGEPVTLEDLDRGTEDGESHERIAAALQEKVAALLKQD